MILDYPLASRKNNHDNTVIKVGSIKIGQDTVVIAGPCAVEDGKELILQAKALSKMGVHILRGGAYKPRTSPYSFSGLGEEGLRILREARVQSGLPFVTEITDVRDIGLFCRYADIIQVGSRNMHNYSLLKELGKVDRPILLKRGYSATLKEWLLAAEYILSGGNEKVILCERGIRCFDTYTRYTFDINAIPAVKMLSHLPVLADPSHATGRVELVAPVARAALAAGADGIMVEVHPEPARALSDGKQSLTIPQFVELMSQIKV